MIMSLKQKNIKFKPRIKLNHNIHTNMLSVLFGCSSTSGGNLIKVMCIAKQEHLDMLMLIAG